MFHIVLVSPEIPPNTGNIIRLSANAGATLHLVEPLGFPLDDAKMRRAGLDYHEYAEMRVHTSWDTLMRKEEPDRRRMFAFTTRATRRYTTEDFAPGDWFVFGSETRGLPDAVRNDLAAEQHLRVPMRPDNRSINLSNAVAIVLFEAWRQHDFAGGV